MDRKFRSLSNGREIDLIPYLKDQLSKSEDIKMYVGTDSQNVGGKTIYATVIVLHRGNRGGHVIYSKKYVDRIKDKFTKLWNEVQDSVDLAQFLESYGIEKPAYIDLDFNPDPRFHSNTILRSALGYVESLGYVPRCKPDAISASYVADKICK
jgi:predicted RNase H-related nuclease YkuK (DUF458 family)